MSPITGFHREAHNPQNAFSLLHLMDNGHWQSERGNKASMPLGDDRREIPKTSKDTCLNGSG